MSEFLDILSPKALADLNEANKIILEIVKNVNKANQNPISAPSQTNSANQKLIDDYAKMEKAIQSLQAKLQKASQQQQANAEKTRLADIRLEQQREKSFDNYDKQLKKEQEQLSKTENTYNKIQNKINSMIPVYNNLQAKQKLGLTLSAKEDAQLRLLESRLVKYQNILKDVDQTIGNHRRSVGDYAKGNVNLANSIGQISRELPNFGQSFSIGVLSLTNNIGALIDGVKQVKEENKNLVEQGEEAKSVFSQIKSAVFSWQTALFIAVGIFSAYSKEISDWVESLWKGSEALQAVTQAQKEMNKVRLEASKSTLDEKTKINELISVAKNQTISLEEREIALKKLRSQYPFYFKDLKDEVILNGDVAGSLSKLALAVDKRAIADKKDELIIKNKERILELQDGMRGKMNEEVKELENFDKAYGRKLKSREEYIDQVKKRFTNLSDWLIVGEDQKFKDQLQEMIGLQTINIKAQGEINQLRAESIGLDFQPEREEKQRKDKREKIALNYAEVESEYNLKLAILERQKAERADRMNNEDLGFDIRLKARQEFSDKSIEILDLETQKEKAILRDKYLEDLDKNNLAYKNKDINAKQWSDNMLAIQNRLSNELQTVDLKYSLEWNNLLNENAKFYRDFQDKNREYTEQTNKLILESEKARYEKTSNDAKKTLETRQKAFEQFIEFSKKELELQKIKDLANAKSNEEVILINQRYTDSIGKINELISPLQKSREATEDFINKLSSGQLEKSLNSIGLSSAKMFLDFDKNGQSTFDKLFEGADTLAEKFALTFQGIGDVAQDIFGKIMEMSNQNFENEYNNLSRQKEISLLFAGESASAREEIERQYDVRQREIKRRQAQAEKRQALFNIAVDTAQAIVATLARTPLPAGLPLVIATGALGAIQAGIVASQQIPQFWRGTENAPEGWAFTQEKGAEIITDKNNRVKYLGDGNGAQLTYLNKGDKVKTASMTKELLSFDQSLNNILMSNRIDNAPKIDINNSAMSDAQVDRIVRTIENKTEYTNIVDQNGFTTLVKKGNTIYENKNRKINFKGTQVG